MALSFLEWLRKNRTRDAATEIEADLHAAFDGVPTIIRSLDGRILYWSMGAERLYGWTRREVAGQVAHRLLSTVFPTAFADVEADLLRDGQWYGTLRQKRRDGQGVSVATQWILRRDSAGRPSAVVEIENDITDLRGNEEALRVADIVESSQDAIYGVTLDGIVTSWNPAAQAMYGCKPEDIVGRPITLLLPPDHAEEERQILERVRRGERIEHFETMRRRKDGSAFAISLTVSPIRDAEGRIIGASKIARDITERRRAEERSKGQEARYRAIVDTAVDAIAVIDEFGKIQSFNPAAEKVFGYTAEEVAGRNVNILMPEPYHHEHDGYLEAYRRGGPAKIIGIGREVRGRRKDGSVFPLELSVAEWRDDGRRYFTGIMRDITARKEAEEALRASEERFRVVVEAVPEMVWTTAPDGTNDFLNARWYAYTGRTEQEGRHWGWGAVVHPEDLERCLSRWKHSLETGEDYEMEYRVRRYDGAYHWFLARARAVRDQDGRILRWFGICTDIDDLRRTQSALTELNETLEERISAAVAEREAARAQLIQAQKMEAVGQLTGGIAHDFNNLLTSVIGNLDLIRKAAADQRIRGLAERAMHAANRGAQLTSQLLAFGRRQMLRPQPLMVTSVVSGIRPLLDRAVSEMVHMEVHAPSDLWQCRIDKAQFESALLNLALNARDAMPKGGTLIIAARNMTLGKEEAARFEIAPGPYVEVVVTDTGIGMPPEVAAKAFDPFFTTKEVGKGSGLGLSQVYGFVKQSGGGAVIESALGEGTTVRLMLPKASGEAERPPKPELQAAPTVRASARRTILVVEDDDQVLATVEGALDDLGYRTLLAHDPSQAVKILTSDEPIDMLFSDIVLPGGMNGIELARAARRLRQDLKVLLTSGYPGQIWASDGGALEFDIFPKPYRQQELATKIDGMFHGAAAPPPDGGRA